MYSSKTAKYEPCRRGKWEERRRAVGCMLLVVAGWLVGLETRE